LQPFCLRDFGNDDNVNVFASATHSGLVDIGHTEEQERITVDTKRKPRRKWTLQPMRLPCYP